MLACIVLRLLTISRRNREIRKRAFKEVHDRSIIPSDLAEDSGNQRAYNLRRRTIFTLRVCFHWPDKRYLPIIIIARLDALHVLFRSILSSTRDLIIAITRRCITFSMYHVRLILRIVCTRSISRYRVPLSVTNVVGFNAFESILILVESVLIGHDNAKEVNREKEK